MRIVIMLAALAAVVQGCAQEPAAVQAPEVVIDRVPFVRSDWIVIYRGASPAEYDCWIIPDVEIACDEQGFRYRASTGAVYSDPTVPECHETTEASLWTDSAALSIDLGQCVFERSYAGIL